MTFNANIPNLMIDGLHGNGPLNRRTNFDAAQEVSTSDKVFSRKPIRMPLKLEIREAKALNSISSKG